VDQRTDRDPRANGTVRSAVVLTDAGAVRSRAISKGASAAVAQPWLERAGAGRADRSQRLRSATTSSTRSRVASSCDVVPNRGPCALAAMSTRAPGVKSVCVVRAGIRSACRFRDCTPPVAISAVVSAPPIHVAARPAPDVRHCAALLRRALFAVALLVALSGCLPLTADASTASVIQAPFGYVALFVGAGPGEANDVSIVRAPNGVDYLIEDRGAAIAPGSGCTSADANHVICTGDAVRQVSWRSRMAMTG
jgi:hypothetical protein